MKKKVWVLFAILANLIILNSCGSDSTGPEDPYIKITSPVFGDNVYIDNYTTITWEDNIYEDVKIALYRDEELVSYLTGSTESDGEFGWYVDDYYEGNYYYVKITSIINPGISSTSDYFSLIEAYIDDITYPLYNQLIEIASEQTIEWESNYLGKVKIDLYKDFEFIREITDNTYNDGEFNWNVPEDLAAGNDYQIRITSLEDPENTVNSNFFIITNEQFLWAKKLYCNNQYLDFVKDNSGNIYITGSFSETATFGSTTLTSNGSDDIYIIKLDYDGNFIWAKNYGGINTDIACSIEADNSGNIYITGSFYETTTFGSTALTSNGSNDIFVAKLDYDGNCIWANSTGETSNYDIVYSVSLDNMGNVYICGTTGFDNTDILVSKLDNNGNFIWEKTYISDGFDYAYSLKVNNSGDIYVTGSFSETIVLGNNILTPIGVYDMFVMKLNSDGDCLWARSYGGSDYDYGRDLEIDSEGNCYVTGFCEIYEPSIFVTKYDQNGNTVWTNSSYNTNFSCSSNSIDIDSEGNCYITGYFNNKISLGNTDLISNGEADIFISKINSEGNFIWSKSIGGPSYSIEAGAIILVDSSDNLFIGGIFSESITFGSHTLNNNSDLDFSGFITKYGTDGKER